MCGLKENLRRKRRKNVSPFNFFISLQSCLVIVYSKEKFEIHRVGITTKKALIMRAFLVVKSDIKENPAISRVYFIPRRSEPDSHTECRQK